MILPQWWNCLTKHFSEYISVVKQSMAIYYPYACYLYVGMCMCTPFIYSYVCTCLCSNRKPTLGLWIRNFYYSQSISSPLSSPNHRDLQNELSRMPWVPWNAIIKSLQSKEDCSPFQVWSRKHPLIRMSVGLGAWREDACEMRKPGQTGAQDTNWHLWGWAGICLGLSWPPHLQLHYQKLVLFVWR